MMPYAVLVKRKGQAAELVFGTYQTKEEAAKARTKAGKLHPARTVYVTPKTYPKDVKA